MPPLEKPGDAARPGDGARPSDGGHRGPAEVPARSTGNGADRPAGQPELRSAAGPGTRDRSPAETLNRADYNQARHARPAIERAAAPPEKQDHANSGPPQRADGDSVRALYGEYLGNSTTIDITGPGRDRGTNVVGEKPDKSPGDTGDLPPKGTDLLETEDKGESRGDKFRKKLNDDIGDVIDLEKDGVETVKNLMERPSPAGHPEMPVNSRPVFGSEIPQHGTVDAGSVAELGLVLGVVGFQAGRWIHHKIETARKE
jgi:hypothetical protein